MNAHYAEICRVGNLEEDFQHIRKTYLYNFDPIKPHFLYSKTGGLQAYTLFFLFLLKNIHCGYLLEPLGKAVLASTHNLCFEQKYEKQNQNFYLKTSRFWWWNFQ